MEKSFEHLVLSMYVVFVLVDLGLAWRDKVRLRNKLRLNRSFVRIFAHHHIFTVLSISVFYVVIRIVLFFL